MPHGRHIYAKAYDMENSKTFAYPQSDHSLPHWKCSMRCSDKSPSVNIPDQETDDQYSDTSPSILFHIYHPCSLCSTHVRIPFNEKKLLNI